jgi:RNA polymerase sigma-70 factor (ECF subfamily)
MQSPHEGDLHSYIFVSVRNAAYDVQRHQVRARDLRQSMFDSDSRLRSEGQLDSDDLLTEERDEILRQAVEELSDQDREILVLKAFGGLTFEAISDVVQQPVKTVASRYRRALQKLEEKLRGKL